MSRVSVVRIMFPRSRDRLGVVSSSLKMVQSEPVTPSVATDRNRETIHAQHFVPNNVAICCVEMLRSFGGGFTCDVLVLTASTSCCSRLSFLCSGSLLLLLPPSFLSPTSPGVIFLARVSVGRSFLLLYTHSSDFSTSSLSSSKSDLICL